jgi:hypothetical protein
MAIKTDDGRAWMRIQEASDYYSVARRTIYTWIEKGQVQTRKGPSGTTFVLVDTRGWQQPGHFTEAAREELVAE